MIEKSRELKRGTVYFRLGDTHALRGNMGSEIDKLHLLYETVQ